MRSDIADADIDALFAGQFLNQHDVDPAVDVTIRDVQWHHSNSRKRGGKGERIKIIFDDDGVKPWLISKTDALVLRALFGRPRQWEGKTIRLARDKTVRMKGKITGGVRIVGTPHMDADSRMIECEMKNGKVFRRTVRFTGQRRGPSTLTELCQAWSVLPGALTEWATRNERQDPWELDEAGQRRAVQFLWEGAHAKFRDPIRKIDRALREPTSSDADDGAADNNTSTAASSGSETA